MDKIYELKKLKELIESLNQEKLDNEKTIEEIKNEEKSITKIEKNINGLKSAKGDLRLSKFLNVIIPMFCILSFAILASNLYLGELQGIIGTVLYGGIGCFFCFAFSSVIKNKILKYYGCSSIKEINMQIEEKEKQKELIKSKSESNKEILVEKEKRQIELDEEIKRCATELSKYEAVKDDIVNEFLNSHEFLQKLNNRMLESEEVVKEERGPQKTLK